jgi:hypothetical protein
MTMKVFIEQWYPTGLALVATVAYLIVTRFIQWPPPHNVAAVMAAMGTFAGITVGFLATAKSILIAIDDRKIIRDLRTLGRYKRIINNIWAAIIWSLLMALLSAAWLFVDLTPPTTWSRGHTFFFATWLFVSVLAVSSFFRMINLFKSMLIGAS